MVSNVGHQQLVPICLGEKSVSEKTNAKSSNPSDSEGAGDRWKKMALVERKDARAALLQKQVLLFLQ
jgi:hypothetical protein